jgi:hypothetical protein
VIKENEDQGATRHGRVDALRRPDAAPRRPYLLDNLHAFSLSRPLVSGYHPAKTLL